MNDRSLTILRTLISVIFALFLCSAVFQFAGYNAWLMLTSVAEGAFLHPGAVQQSLRWGLPLFITAAGVCISFRAGFFNIGAQGQFYVGAIFAAFTADWLNGAPAFVVIPSCFLAGMTGGAIDGIARNVIDGAGYGEYFGHALGHGVGLAVHEFPRLGPNAPETVDNSMVFTIEPGIYLPGSGGVRIEDTVIMQGGAVKQLSKARKAPAF